MNVRSTGGRFRTKHARALTLTELLIVIGGVALLAAVFLPAFAKANRRSSKLGCANCLKQIGLALRTFAIDNNDRFPMQVPAANGGSMEQTDTGLVFPHFQAASNELSTPKILCCPNDTQRSYATSFRSSLADSNISYFINVDAAPGSASNVLCGDRNLLNSRSAGSRFVLLTNGARIGWTKEIHSQQGNLCFADGRVEGIRNGSPLSTICLPAGLTNRLAIP